MLLFDELIRVGARMQSPAPLRDVKHHDAVVVHVSQKASGWSATGVSKAPKTFKKTTYLMARSSDVYPTPGPIDTAVYALGWCPNKPKTGKPKHAAYRELARKVAGVGHWPAAALSEVLDNTDLTVLFPELERLGATDNTWVFFDIEGAGEWWRLPEIEALAADLAERKAASDQVIVCPFCEQTRQAARIFGPSAGASLVSFANDSSEAYGAKQGLVAPACFVCASRMSRGLGSLLQSRTTTESPSLNGSTRYVWWSDQHENLWSTLTEPNASISGTSSFLMLDRNKTRWAACRFSTVRLEDVAQRVAHWRSVLGSVWPIQVVSAVCGRDRSRSDLDSAWDRCYTELILHLVCGESLPRSFERSAEVEAEKSPLAARVVRYIESLKPTPPQEEGREQSPFYWLGRAYRRAAHAQRYRVQPQRGMDTYLFQSSKMPPEHSQALITRHMSYRGRDGTEKQDHKTVAYLARVSELVRDSSSTDAEEMLWYKSRPSGANRATFVRGYHDEGEEIWAAIKAAKQNNTQDGETKP